MKIGTVIVIGNVDMDGAQGRDLHPTPEDKGQRALVTGIELVYVDGEWEPLISAMMQSTGQRREFLPYEVAGEYEDPSDRDVPCPGPGYHAPGDCEECDAVYRVREGRARARRNR